MDPCHSVSARVPHFRSPYFQSSKRLSGYSAGQRAGTALNTCGSDSAKQRSGQIYVTPNDVTAFVRHVTPTSTASQHYASEDTLKHLISTIEQLRSKDKVISQLERELGHPAAAAVATAPVTTATTEVKGTTCQAWPGQPGGGGGNRMESPTACGHPLEGLGSGPTQAYHTLHGTAIVSWSGSGGPEKEAVEGFGSLQAELLGLQERAQALAHDRQSLHDKVKDLEIKNKQLVEKNKRFLEKNVELTAHNRNLKDSSHTLQQQHKKLRVEADESRQRMCELARELQRVRGQNLELEAQAEQVEELKTHIAEQTTTIAQLKQACSEKDRRIELIQHRKKRKRLIRSQEKCQGIKETFYGYDHGDEDNDVSVDSETSLSSISVSTISEEDVCDELSHEELERSHRQMIREHLQLQRSHALLQAHTGSSQDPFREFQTRSQLQADLFSAQCRVELLEKEIRTLHNSASRHRRGSRDGADAADPDVIRALTKERDDLLASRNSLKLKLHLSDSECSRLRQDLRQEQERVEDLEFRLLELEDGQHPTTDIPYARFDLKNRDLDFEKSGKINVDLEKRDLDFEKLGTLNIDLEKRDPELHAEGSVGGQADRPEPSGSGSGGEDRELDDSGCPQAEEADGDVKPGRSHEAHQLLLRQAHPPGVESCLHLQLQQQVEKEKCQNKSQETTVTTEVVLTSQSESSCYIPQASFCELESGEMDQLKKELTAALQKYGIKVDTIFKALPSLKNVDQKLTSLERMGMDLQKKVIRLQEERDTLEERLMRGAPLNLVNEVERRQNLELKEEVGKPIKTARDSGFEKESLQMQGDESEHLYRTVKNLESLSILCATQIRKSGDPNNAETDSIGNKGSMEMMGREEETKSKTVQRDACSQTDKNLDRKRRGEGREGSRSRSRERREQTERKEKQALQAKVVELQAVLVKLETENIVLTHRAEAAEAAKLHENSKADSSASSSSDEDDPTFISIKHTPPKPKAKIKSLERQVQVLQSENMRLADRLGGHMAGGDQQFHRSNEIVERIVELEDLCTDLQDHVREIEGQERQMREKLRLAEQTINDLEASEAHYRDHCEDLQRHEREAKRQLHELQATGQELREIIQDKDFLEQSLREKVEFFEKVEMQSTQRIMELEALEKTLREQLHCSESEKSGEGSALAAIKEKLFATEKEVTQLKVKNAELEENEEILRENWRRVADEDANRIQCLEEKVRMMEALNHDLKNRVAEAQDFVVINSGPPVRGSLADELSASVWKKARPVTSERSLSAGSDEDSGDDSPSKRVIKLKRQLSFLEEEKNSKIASLQERVAQMRENEIKLSETLAEMEMTERELRAKLALYESSEVTVEKMLKYQDKINELKTSQESLLDQLETMETQELTLQERLEETERHFKGKIVTLEVEMKGLKQKELRGNARIRELEKHEQELMEKTKKQEEKENSLYVRISGLMDQLKEHKATIEKLEKKVTEKDERCRKVASLETKFLEIEAAYREKVSSLESSVAEVEGMLVEEQNRHEETRALLEKQSAATDSLRREHSQRVAILEETFTQKERSLIEKIAALETAVAERDRKIARLDKEQGVQGSEISRQQSQMLVLEETLKEKVCQVNELEKASQEKEDRLRVLEEGLRNKDSSTNSLHQQVVEMQTQLSLLQERLTLQESREQEKDAKIIAAEAALSQKVAQITELSSVLGSMETSNKQLREMEEKVLELQKQLEGKDSKIALLEKDLQEKNVLVLNLEHGIKDKEARLHNYKEQLTKVNAEMDIIKVDASKHVIEISEKGKHISLLEMGLRDKSEQVSTLENSLHEKSSQVTKLQKEISDKNLQNDQLTRELNTQLSKVITLEKDLDAKEIKCIEIKTHLELEKKELHAELKQKASVISHLQSELSMLSTRSDKLQKDLLQKESQISDLAESLSIKCSELSRLEEDMDKKSNSFSDLHQMISDKDLAISCFKKEVSEKDASIKQLYGDLADREQQICKLETRLHETEVKLSDSFTTLKGLQADRSNKDSDMVQMEEQIIEMSSTISALQKELEDKNNRVNMLHKHLCEFDEFICAYVTKYSKDVTVNYASFRDKLNFLQGELESEKAHISEQHITFAQLTDQMTGLKADILAERKKVAVLTDSLQTTESERKQLQVQLNLKDSQLLSSVKEAEFELQTKFSVRESEFQQACASLDRECDSLRKELSDKDSVIERLESNKNELLSKIENLKDKEKNLAGIQSALEADIDKLCSRLQCVEAEKEMAEAGRVSAESKCSLIEAELQLEREQSRDRFNSINKELQSSTCTVDQQHLKIFKLEKELHSLQEQLQQHLNRESENYHRADVLMQQESMLKSHVAQVEAELKVKSRTLEEEQTSSSSKLKQLKQEHEAKLVSLQKDLSESLKDNVILQQSLSELTSKNQSLEQQVSELLKQVENKEDESNDLKSYFEEEQERIRDLEMQIKGLNQEKDLALTKAEHFQHEINEASENIRMLKNQISEMEQNIILLKSENNNTEQIKQNYISRITELTQEIESMKTSNLRKDQELLEKEKVILKLNSDLESKTLLTTCAEKKASDLQDQHQKEKKLLQEKVLMLEATLHQQQKDYSSLSLKLQVLEKRKNELLEQITNVEQTVIEPLDMENSELKEELKFLKKQIEDLNIQMDKEEAQARDDAEELDSLRVNVRDLTFARSEIQTKMDILTKELSLKDAEAEALQEKLIDLETSNKHLEDQLENNRVEMDKLTLQFEKETCSRDAQTDLDLSSTDVETSAMRNKLRVLQDAESKFMFRIMELEEHEQQLEEQLIVTRQHLQDAKPKENKTSLTQKQVALDTVDASIATEFNQEGNMAKVQELVSRVQELEATNQKLMSTLEQSSASQLEVKQLTDKLHLLEQSEDRLMERVMELEENEVMLRTQLDRSNHKSSKVDELEEEVTLLLHQEDEWKEKVSSLSAENENLAKSVQYLEQQLKSELGKSEILSEQLLVQKKQQQDSQRELKLVQTKLQSVRSEYEEKISAFEESEKKMENQMGGEKELQMKVKELQEQVQVLKEDLEDLCERYKELELENSTVKHQYATTLDQLRQAESKCLQLQAPEATIQASKAMSQNISLAFGENVSVPSPSVVKKPQQSSNQPQVCSNLSVQFVQSLAEGADDVCSNDSLLRKISELEKELSEARQKTSKNAVQNDSGNQGYLKLDTNPDNHITSEPKRLLSSVPSTSSTAQTVKVLTLRDALEENACLKAKLEKLSVLQQSTLTYTNGSRLHNNMNMESETTKLQQEVRQLKVRVEELEREVKEAEGAVAEVVTVVRTRSIHTLEQKIETIQRTIHTHSQGWSLHQELLELLTSQADLQKQVSYLMETEHNLRMTLKQTEEELARVKSGSSLSARRIETERRLNVQSRLSQFGGGSGVYKTPRDLERSSPVTSARSQDRLQWLEHQVTDLQLAKSSLERRLNEAERRLAFRPRPTAASREELLFRIEQLQDEQAGWRKKVEDLQALNSHYLKEKLELAQETNTLNNKLQELGAGSATDLSPYCVRGVRQEPVGRSASASDSEGGSETMLEKPEDILQRRIKELETLEDYLRQQVTELEADREQLHEIARKDKAVIHEQNVRLRELMLQERNLRSQLTSLEDNERSLYTRCGEQEDKVARLEDRVHELEVHERRLRELVRKLKLDEEVWLSRSGDLTEFMQQLSSKEVTLKKTVQDLQLEKGGLSDRAEHLQARVSELEAVETSLVQRLKNYENMEASLNAKLVQLEKSEAAAYSKASELDVINMDLSARLQRAVEENAVLSQHVAQLQGQIYQLDRKLSAALDAEVGLTQHVESLQKHEAALQKKVREYELRDIDAKARIRELEQTEEILKDKVNQLQRNENRLKARLAEFETVGSQALETLSPLQKQQLPQKLEDCQKLVVALQQQLEATKGDQSQLKKDATDIGVVKVPATTLSSLQARAVLLEETEKQMSELETANSRLSLAIMQLQQGKGSCGHEVELESLKKRLHSYQTSIQKLKHHLSEGQVPSLWAPDIGQGPETEDLPARNLQQLESERVLHSVRSFSQNQGLQQAPNLTEKALSKTVKGFAVGATTGATSVSQPEESHWQRVEQKQQAQGAESRGTLSPAHLAVSRETPTTATKKHEELTVELTLASESDWGSQKSQNDTDSEISGAHFNPHLRVVGSTSPRRGGGIVVPDHAATTAVAPGAVPSPGRAVMDRSGNISPLMPTFTPTTSAVAAAKAAWPLVSSSLPTVQQQQQKLIKREHFAKDDSFYLPSSAVSETESVDDERDVPPPLPSSAPPGVAATPAPSSPQQQTTQSKTFISSVALPTMFGSGTLQNDSQRARLQSGSAVGLTIRQRIAQIEQNLKESPVSSRAGSRAEEEDLATLRSRASENVRLLGVADRENKQLKNEIIKLEKDLEEKLRYVNIFEKWILDAEEVLKNKNKKNDRDLVQQLQTELKNLKQDLSNAGFKKDDIFTDLAVLKTELDQKDREFLEKCCELESLQMELDHWHEEYVNVEKMRSNALDSLRLLEAEVAQLQDADAELKQMKDEYNTLRGQYDELELQKTKAVSAVHTLRAKVARLAKKCQEKDELLLRLCEELKGSRGQHSSSLIEELTRLEALASGEEYNRPLSPVDLATGPTLSETERLLLERIPRWPSSSSLADPHDLASGLDPPAQRRPRSAEQVRNTRSINHQHQQQHFHSAWDASQFTAGLSHSVTGGRVKAGLGFALEEPPSLFVAILDYKPDADSSRSGHRQLELPLKEGEQVHVLGPVDRQGYCEAEVGGRTGLVPASHLYPLTARAGTYRSTGGRHTPQQKKPDGDSVDQIVLMFNELQDPTLLSDLTATNRSSHAAQPTPHQVTTAMQTLPLRKTKSTKLPVPEAPSKLHIDKIDGSSIVLSWQPPQLDIHGCSNGTKVVGYRIYLNGRVCQQPHSALLSQTRIDGLRHDRPQQLAIQTLASNGQVSSRVELVYQGAPPSLVSRQQDEDREDTDLSSILNSIQYRTGKKRTVMGLYDYDPQKQSPGDFPTRELSFKTGDIMQVYGEERQDGFYHGERSGQRGLVPACFVEFIEGETSQKNGSGS